MPSDSTEKIGLRLDPLDVLAFRDGRPFDAGSTAKSGLPMPQSLAGALRTALLDMHGCSFRKLAEKVGNGALFAEAVAASGAPEWIAKVAFRGPWLARGIKEDLTVYVPTPANLHREKEGDAYHALHPIADISVPGWRPPGGESGMLPLWAATANRTERVKGFISLSGLKTYLRGEPVQEKDVIADAEGTEENRLFSFDERTGIGIDPDSLATEEGLIYGIGFLSLNTGICFYAEAVLPDDEAEKDFHRIGTLSLGGEGRKATLSVVKPVEWPDAAPSDPKDRSFVLLTTPAFFTAQWRPSALEGRLTAAAVPGYVSISGWDLAKRGPKPTRYAAAPGSVFFMNQAELNLPAALTDQEEDRLSGYGCYLKGVWTDE